MTVKSSYSKTERNCIKPSKLIIIDFIVVSQQKSEHSIQTLKRNQNLVPANEEFFEK